MNGAIGHILPLAMGVAITPVPVMAVLVLLISAQAKRRSLAFLAGWMAGIIVSMVLFILATTLLAGALAGHPRPLLGAIQLVLGTLLLMRAARLWRHRPALGGSTPWPAWMASVEQMSIVTATGRGCLQVVANPKNLLLTASAATSITESGLDVGEQVLVIAIFTAIAGSLVCVPVVAGFSGSARVRSALIAARDWLELQNAGVMTVVLLVMGSVVLGKGLGQF